MLGLPLSTSACVAVSESYFTKCASRGVAPTNAPWCHWVSRNVSTSRRIEAQSGSPFSSKKIHRRPRAGDSLILVARRRTGRYRNSLAGSAGVRAPQTLMPSSSFRMQLMLIGFSYSCSISEMEQVRPRAPRNAIFAGASWTPRKLSVFANARAI